MGLKHQQSNKTRTRTNSKIGPISDNDERSRNDLEKLTIVGLGLTGTLLSVSFANKGHKVIAVDMDSRKVNCVNQNHSPIQDSELETAIRKARFNRNLVATGDLHNAILQTDISLICTGQKSVAEQNVKNHSVEMVCQQLGASLAIKSKYHLIVLHSNLNPMVCENQVKPIIEHWSNKRCGIDFGLCYLPLHVSHKSQHSPTRLHDSIIHGAYDNKSAKLAARLFASLDIGLKTVSLNPQ